MKTVPLSSLATKIGSGITPTGGEKAYVENGVLFIRSQNVRRGRLQINDVARITPEQHRQMESTRLQEGDVLLNITGASIGRSCVFEDVQEEANVNQHVCIIRPRKGVSGQFLSAFLNSYQGQREVYSFQGGGSREGLNFEQVGRFKVPNFDSKQQLRIAEVLKSWDSAIGSAEQLVAANIQRLKWIASALLTGKQRLASFSTPWKEVKLSNVLTEHKLRSSGAEEVHSVSVRHGLINQIEHLGRSFAAASTTNYNLVRPGDIVYTKSPTGDFPLGIVKQSKLARDAIVSPLYGVFTPSSNALGLIIDTLFSFPEYSIRYLTPLVQKGAKNTIAVTNSQFLAGRLMLPADPSEIEQLAELVRSQNAIVGKSMDRVEALRDQKVGLMQRLLTGQWNAPDIDEDVIAKAASPSGEMSLHS